MALKTININEEQYRRLLHIAAGLQRERGRHVSINEALDNMEVKKYKKRKLSELAGSWKTSDEEWEKIKRDLRKGWKKWKMPSV